MIKTADPNPLRCDPQLCHSHTPLISRSILMSFSDTDSGAGFGIRGTATSGDGLRGQADTGTGVQGSSRRGRAVVGTSQGDAGVTGESDVLEGVVGTSKKHHGMRGQASDKTKTGVLGTNDLDGNGVAGVSKGGYGVFGQTDFYKDIGGAGVFGVANKTGYGVYGYSPQGPAGSVGISDDGFGLFGQSSSTAAAIFGRNVSDGTGVHGNCNRGEGVVGVSDQSNGVRGRGERGIVGEGKSFGAILSGDVAVKADGKQTAVLATGSSFGVQGKGGIFGLSGASAYVGTHGEGGVAGVAASVARTGHAGVMGAVTSTPTGVFGTSEEGYGVLGISVNGAAVGGKSPYPRNIGPYGFAGNFQGAVNVTGPVHKSGGGFKIDHPLAPTSMYLNHSFVESPEMKNVYDGVVVLNNKGEAAVTLPTYFEALNREFRYQLTAVGAPAPNLHVVTEITGGTFRIAGGTKGARVCWQVTGIRCDPWAEANEIHAEEKKTRLEQGTYRHPEVYGKPDDLSVEWVTQPRLLAELKKRRRGESLVETHRAMTLEVITTADAALKRGKLPHGAGGGRGPAGPANATKLANVRAVLKRLSKSTPVRPATKRS
jgi:hypothetical protein